MQRTAFQALRCKLRVAVRAADEQNLQMKGFRSVLGSVVQPDLTLQQFIVLVSFHDQVSNLRRVIVETFQKLYPGEPKLEFTHIKDAMGFDIDEAFVIGEIFEPNDLVAVVVSSKSGILTPDSYAVSPNNNREIICPTPKVRKMNPEDLLPAIEESTQVTCASEEDEESEESSSDEDVVANLQAQVPTKPQVDEETSCEDESSSEEEEETPSKAPLVSHPESQKTLAPVSSIEEESSSEEEEDDDSDSESEYESEAEADQPSRPVHNVRPVETVDSRICAELESEGSSSEIEIKVSSDDDTSSDESEMEPRKPLTAVSVNESSSEDETTSESETETESDSDNEVQAQTVVAHTSKPSVLSRSSEAESTSEEEESDSEGSSSETESEINPLESSSSESDDESMDELTLPPASILPADVKQVLKGVPKYTSLTSLNDCLSQAVSGRATPLNPVNRPVNTANSFVESAAPTKGRVRLPRKKTNASGYDASLFA